MEGAAKIWGEFERWRYEREAVRDEEAEVEQADGEWGMRELEEAEREGRQINGEYEFGIRGYGE